MNQHHSCQDTVIADPFTGTFSPLWLTQLFAPVTICDYLFNFFTENFWNIEQAVSGTINALQWMILKDILYN